MTFWISDPATVFAASAGTGRQRHSVEFHRIGDEAPKLLCSFDQVRIRKMSLACRGFLAAITEQFAHRRQVLPRHDGVTGENLPLVGKLLGHQRHRTTAGYAHLADGHLIEVAQKIGGIIMEAMQNDKMHN